MKRLVLIFTEDNDHDGLRELSEKINRALLDDNITNIILTGKKDAVVQIVELEELNGEYKCINISAKGVKAQWVTKDIVSSW